jgi:hypothetical protein
MTNNNLDSLEEFRELCQRDTASHVMIMLGMPADEKIHQHYGVKYTPDPSATKSHCIKCGMDVWLGAKQTAVVADPSKPTAVLCMICGVTLSADTDSEIHTDDPLKFNLDDIGNLHGTSGTYEYDPQQYPHMRRDNLN